MPEGLNETEEINFQHDKDTLLRKIQFLEEELVRKDSAIEKLRQENELLFRSMIKTKENNTFAKHHEHQK